MKKLLSLIVALAVIVSAVAVFSVNASAADNTLTITSNGEVLGEVEVGNQFIFHVALDSGGYSLNLGEANIRYNDSYVKVVEHGTVNSSGKVNMNAYSFPVRIRNSNLITNYLGEKNLILYNFSKYSGVGVFTPEEHYFKIRFQAIAPGTVEIRHYAKCFYAGEIGSDIRLIYDDRGNAQLDPIPYTVSSIEPAVGYVGDANGDHKLNVMDATFVQRLAAGVDSEYNPANADVNADNEVNLKDAYLILRHNAGAATNTKIGEWLFESETK